MSNTIGKIFCVTTFGESHGSCIGAVVDGCPALVNLSEEDVQAQLDRRRPGLSRISSPRNERDRVEILSGVQGGRTLGSPIALMIRNTDVRSRDYQSVSTVPRPSHADLTYRLKYGIAAESGGGRASARETAARVAAGAVAEKYLAECFGIEIVAWVSAAGGVDAPDLSGEAFDRERVDESDVRCPDPETARMMTDVIDSARKDGDSVGGIVTCLCRNVPAGWGEPVFNKMEAALGSAMLSIPAAKGFDLGSGFLGSGMRGSENNDMFVMKNGTLGTVTNRSGGVQGGITNGEPVVFRTAFKPTATIRKEQETVDYDGSPVNLEISKGRHDPCVAPRAVPVVESMSALVLADMARLACGARAGE